MGALAAIVAAAGVSSRMGALKPLLDIGGRTMIRRVTDTLRGAGADPVVVVTGYRGEQIEAELAGTGVRFVRNDRYYETEMFDSLLLGAAALPRSAERVLFTPADIPLVESGTVMSLLAAEGDFIRPCCGGVTGHPVVLSRALLDRLGDYAGEGGLRGALPACGVEPTDVAVEDTGTLLDGDTREQYAALLRHRRETTGERLPLQMDLRVTMRGEDTFWGPGCAQLLELVQASGSIRRACECMHMAYSKGWQMIRQAEAELGFPLLTRSRGGSAGGGSALTAEGAAFLDAWRRMEREIRERSQLIFERYFPEGRVRS